MFEKTVGVFWSLSLHRVLLEHKTRTWCGRWERLWKGGILNAGFCPSPRFRGDKTRRAHMGTVRAAGDLADPHKAESQ